LLIAKCRHIAILTSNVRDLEICGEIMTTRDSKAENRNRSIVSTGEAHRNMLYEAILRNTRETLESHSRRFRVKNGDILGDSEKNTPYVYFPESAVLATSVALESGTSIDIINIGNEGAFGLLSNNYGSTFQNQCATQFDGDVIQLPLSILNSAIDKSECIRLYISSYLYIYSKIAHQLHACSSIHSVHERLCRWLLLMHDHAECEQLPFTHEKLSRSLGVDRKSITVAAQGLQLAGAISYTRGVIKIEDRFGLESAACECYGVVRQERHRYVRFLQDEAHSRVVERKLIR
jgi:hypothetical protein